MQHPPYFRMLGTLDAEVAGTRVALGSPQARGMLAVLLLRANRLCPIDQLTHDLWGGAPPRSARAQVQNHVSTLRRTFEVAGGASAGDFLVTRPPGYQVVLGPDQTDLARFQQLLSTARERRTRDDLAAASAYREALDLWRGGVLADVTLPAVRERAAHLDELHVDALEEWAGVALATGSAEEVAAELGTRTALYPLRERLRAALIRALAACGRTADALEVFRAGRAVLVEELGIEPGAELQDAHRAVLSSSVTAPAGAGALPESPGPPVALPPDLDDFSGRDEVVRAALRLLSARAPVVLGISGPAGVGKSSLAVHLAHAAQEQFPGGRILLRLHGDAEASAGTVVASCLRLLDVPAACIPGEPADQGRLLQSYLRRAPVLVVVDGVTREDQVRPLLDLDSRGALVLTSRRRLDGLDCVSHVELLPMPEAEGLQLITRTVGADRAGAVPRDTADLVRYCEGLPLALRICAARLTARPAWTVGDLVARLRAERSRLDWLRSGDRAVRSSFDLTYRQVDEPQRRLFRRLGVLNTPTFPSWVAGALLDVDPETAEPILDALGDVRLVEAAGRGPTGPRYRMHGLLRLFARERAVREDSPGEVDAALGRTFDGWLVLAQSADEAAPGKSVVDPEPAPRWRPPGPALDGVRADPTGWRETEHPCLVAAVRTAVERRQPRAAWPLAQRTSTYYDTSNDLPGWQGTLHTALGACRSSGDAAGTACLLRHLSDAYAIGGDLTAAQEAACEAGVHYSRLDPGWGTASLGPRVAFIHRMQGRIAEARTCAVEAVRAARTGTDHIALGRALNCLAVVEMDGGELPAAVRAASEAHEAFTAAGSKAGALETLALSGDLARRSGDLGTAEQRLTRAVNDALRTGDRGLAGLFTIYLARNRRALGRTGEAVALARRARDTLRDANDRNAEAIALTELGTATLEAHGPAAAVPVLAEGVEAWTALGTPSRADALYEALLGACEEIGDEETAARHRPT